MKRAAQRAGRGRQSVREHGNPLQRKYRELCLKYEALVHKLEGATETRISAQQIGQWALRTARSGLALLRNGAVMVSNDRFDQLDQPLQGRQAWELVLEGGGPGGTHVCLRDLAVEAAAELMASGAPAAPVRRFRRVGRPQLIEVRLERLPPAFRGDATLALLAHDVTAIAEAEEELRRVHEALAHQERVRAVGELASGVAHDLNNSLHAMRLRLELLRNDDALTPRQRENLDFFFRCVHDATGRVGRLQDLARKRQHPPDGPIDLAAALRDAVALAHAGLEHETAISEKHYPLEVAIPELPPVRAFDVEVKHMVVNLILNARDSMPAGGPIEVCARAADQQVIVTVSDRGTGIPEENLQRIFDPFFTTKGDTGMGLGLSMAAGIMARLGGSIVAQNRQGGGAELTLRFPVSSVQVLAVPPPRLPRAVRRKGSLRVLVVDDSAENLSVTCQVLEAEGMRVRTAEGGAAALRTLRKSRFDLILCDLGMPGITGWQVAQAARRLAPATPFFLLTGWAKEISDDDERRKLVAGVLPKPVEVDDLRALLSKLAS